MFVESETEGYNENGRFMVTWEKRRVALVFLDFLYLFYSSSEAVFRGRFECFNIRELLQYQSVCRIHPLRSWPFSLDDCGGAPNNCSGEHFCDLSSQWKAGSGDSEITG